MGGLLAVLLLAQPAADVRRLVGRSDATAKRLAEIEQAAAAGKGADALDDLLRLLDQAGDDLVTTDGRQFRPARSVAHRVLAKLPPAVLRSYRDRVAGPADALLAAGRRDRDPRPLRTLADRYPLSAAAEPGLVLLGELLFERGEFREAEWSWRRLLGDPAADPGPPAADPARVRALVGLALLFQGDAERAAAELARLQTDQPSAAGRLAGRDGPYADTLAALLKQPPRRPAPTGGGTWTGFAGNPARDGRVSGRLPKYWPTRPTWSAAFPPLGQPPTVLPTPTARSVAYHPVVLDGVGYVADPLRVFAFDPLTGAGRVVLDLRRDARLSGLPVEERPMPTADADFPLTVADGRLYGRFGQFPVSPTPDLTGRPTTFLARLKSSRSGLDAEWLLPPPPRDGSAVAWEAAPVVAGGRLFAAFTRVDGVSRTYAVAAYADPPGDKPLWVTEVAAAPAGAGPRVRQEPLTLAGGRLVYATHAGSAAALDPQTGKVIWAVAYPPPKRPLPPAARDVCPPLAHGGRVFMAPLDADFVCAVDAATGRELWRADGVQTDHLLGVSRDRLVAAIAAPHKGIRGFDAATGSDQEPRGWRQHDDPQLGSFGRGLVTDDLILWPTRQGLYPLDPADGRLVSDPLPGVHGNLAFASGVLLAGTPFGVSGILPAGKGAPTPRTQGVILAEAGRTREAVELVRAAGLPDADRLAEWWQPTPRPVAVGRAFEPPLPTAVRPRDVTRVAAVTRFPGPVVPLRAFGGPDLAGLDAADPVLLVSDGRRVSAYVPGEDRPAWAVPLSATLTHAAVTPNDVLVAGPTHLARLNRADGRLVWSFDSSSPAGRFAPASPPLPPGFRQFTLAGGRLCCRLGDKQLIGLDPADGRVTWTRDGLFLRGDPHPWPTVPGWTHLCCPDGRRLFARRTDGKLFVLDPASGDVLHTAPTAAVPWDGPPVSLGRGRVSVADGPDTLSVWGDRAEPVWGASLGGHWPSLWGRPPQMRLAGDILLAAVARNHGTELEAVRSRDGRRHPGWPDDPVFLSAGPVELAAADAVRVYVTDGSHLTAVRLADGRPEWRVPAAGRWRVRAGSTLLLVPTEATPAEPFGRVAANALRRFVRRPHAGLLLGLYDAWVGRTARLVRLDPATGRTLAVLELPAAGPAVAAHLGPGPAVVVTGTAAHWLD